MIELDPKEECQLNTFTQAVRLFKKEIEDENKERTSAKENELDCIE